MSGRLIFALLLVWTSTALACVGLPALEGLPDGGGSERTDADPSAPDADPSAPDANPGAADARPYPDAIPGTPDANPPCPLIDAGPSDPDAGPPGDEPGSGVVWLDYGEQQSISDGSWGTALTDVVRHLPASYGTTYYDSDKVTHGHETSHGIHSHLRNYFNNTGQQANGFYVLGDRAAIIVEPDIRKSDVAAYVPSVLRGSRFSLYITGSTAWDDTPLYVWDEWVAYTNGGIIGVDLVNAGMWSFGWRDAVMGQLEFTVYALATAMAVADLDPTYFATNTQFKEFLAWNMKRAMDNYRQGAAMSEFSWATQDSYYEALRTNSAAEPIVQFARDTFGLVWANQVLGIN